MYAVHGRLQIFYFNKIFETFEGNILYLSVAVMDGTTAQKVKVTKKKRRSKKGMKYTQDSLHRPRSAVPSPLIHSHSLYVCCEKSTNHCQVLMSV